MERRQIMDAVLVLAGVAILCGVMGAAWLVGFYGGAAEIAQTYSVENSPIYADNGKDESRMDDFKCTILDHSENGHRAMGKCYNAALTNFVEVTDLNGAGGGGNTKSMPFRGEFHAACNRADAGCGSLDRH